MWGTVVGLVLWLVSGRMAAELPPAAFQDRTPLPSCGSVVLGQRDPVGRTEPEIDCFEQAIRRGAGAELVVTRPTVEGDPLIFYYRALPQGTVEYFVDATQDSFGSRTWFDGVCTAPDPDDFLNSC